MEQNNLNLISKTIWLRLAQILVNNRYKNGDFVVPIHLAMGHEAIAVAVDAILQENDALFLTHRNVHYNLARMGTLKEELDEYYLRKSGLAQGRLGSMNLSNPDKSVPYASNILGNNLPVGCGYALGHKHKKTDGVVFITTGDGAMEEGSFYESLLFLKSNQLAAVVIIENNDWSLATKIDERRVRIDVAQLAASLGIEYVSLEGNDPLEYRDKMGAVRANTIANNSPIVVEVKLTTLGYWYMANDDHPKGKFINYHCGPAPEVKHTDAKTYPVIVSSDEDPLHVLTKYLSMEQLVDISDAQFGHLEAELS